MTLLRFALCCSALLLLLPGLASGQLVRPVKSAPVKSAPVKTAKRPAASCPAGMLGDREGHCCWPEQKWGQGLCRGTPTCPAGFRGEANGCVPIADGDGDGVPDALDRCPDKAETVNGFEDGDGCPDERPAGVKESPSETQGWSEAFQQAQREEKGATKAERERRAATYSAVVAARGGALRWTVGGSAGYALSPKLRVYEGSCPGDHGYTTQCQLAGGIADLRGTFGARWAMTTALDLAFRLGFGLWRLNGDDTTIALYSGVNGTDAKLPGTASGFIVDSEITVRLRLGNPVPDWYVGLGPRGGYSRGWLTFTETREGKSTSVEGLWHTWPLGGTVEAGRLFGEEESLDLGAALSVTVDPQNGNGPFTQLALRLTWSP